MKQRRVAIVSDVMMSFGGAERVVMTLMEMFPTADFYTLFISPSGRKKIEDKFPKIIIRTSIFQNLIRGDKISKYISIIKLFSWIYWEYLDLKKYDLIISSSHSYMSKNVKKRSGAKHLAYIHTPPRYLYDEFNEIGFIKKIPWIWFLGIITTVLRYIDRNGSKRADILIANSKNVAKRIEKYYRRRAKVVYPPVKIKILSEKTTKSDYYVCLSRLVRQKGIDLAVRTCTNNNLPLVVIGNGDELRNLKKVAGPKVKFVEKCEDQQKFELLAGARALIYTSTDEDFGIVPVEALKVGTKVIAYNSGGVRETVIDKKNGVFFDEFDEGSLLKAIKTLNKIKITKKDCVNSVAKFSIENFKKQIYSLIEK